MKKVGSNIAFVYSGKPESYNARHKEIYQKKLEGTYRRNYNGMLQNKELYATVFYFYKVDKGLDTDNISKPIWDALTNVAYKDDRQIKIRTAISIDINAYRLLDFDQDKIPSDLCYDLLDSIANNDHTLYVQVGIIEDYSQIFNISTLWN